MAECYIGVLDNGEKSSPGTYEAVCRFLDERQPDRCAALAGFDLSFDVGGTIGFVKHVRRYRNGYDTPHEWAEAGCWYKSPAISGDQR